MATTEKQKLFEKLKRKRSTVKTAVTKLLNRIDEMVSESNCDIIALEVAGEQLIVKESHILELDKQIEDVIDDLDQLEAEVESSQDYSDKIILGKTKIKRCLKASQNAKEINDIDDNVEDSSSSLPHHCSTSLESKFHVRLPKLIIEKFDGNLEHWQEFWSQFESSVHENKTLCSTEKFVYLKSLLKGSAFVAVQGLLVSNSNYETAINILKERYGKKELLIRAHINTLLNLSPVKNAAHIKELRFLYDTCEIQIRSLLSLDVELKTYGNLLFPIITNLVPDSLLLDYNRKSGNDDDSWDVSKLLEFLKNEIENREKIFSYRNKFEKQEDVVRSYQRYQNSGNKFGTRNFGPRGNSESKTKMLEVSTGAELFSTSEDKGDCNKNLCIFCDKLHLSKDCKNINNLTLNERKSILIKKGACFRCLRRKHISKFCKAKVICSICGNKHCDIMCWSQNDISYDKSNEKTQIDKATENNVLTSQVCQTEVLLQTLSVNIYNGNRSFQVRALIDSGSQRSYASAEIINRLGYKSLGETKLVHTLFGGVQTREKVHQKYLINVGSEDWKFKCSFEVLDQIKICNDISEIPSGIWLEELRKSNICLSDANKSKYMRNGPIHLLIGADIAGKLFTGNIYTCSSGPVAIETKLGWTLMGKIPSRPVNNNTAFFVTSLLAADRLDNLWRLDALGINDPAVDRSKKELQEETMQYFFDTVKREENGRYEVALPWVKQAESLPSNRDIAEKRLVPVKNKLTKMDKYEAYTEIFKSWLNEGIIEQVFDQKQEDVHYLPHRPVIKESSSSTKIRPVFDASASKRGKLSLNDCLESGPNLLEVIPSLLNRFRKNSFGVSADIEKAFLQLNIRPKDRDYLRFIWYGEDGELITYRHQRVVFGVTSSPFLLNATLTHLFNDVPRPFKDTAELLKESFYVDNFLTSLNTVHELEKVTVQSRILLSSAQFNLRDWKSNASTPVIETSYEKNVNVLGLLWDISDDTLLCNFSAGKLESPISKRKLLSVIHRIFDPIGFTCPTALIPKVILRETWNLKLSWDEELPKQLKDRFLKWERKLDSLSSIRIPRWIGFLEDRLDKTALHIFCDASSEAYATCIFLRTELEHKIYVELIQAKSRVAPIKVVSIPRLELMACLIGARLAFKIIQDLRLEGIQRYYWSDSVNALCWIKKDDCWATFVQNRAKEVRSLSNAKDWRHIAGAENPSDLPSRGCTADFLIQSRWWEGPVWLKRPENEWPKSEALPVLDIVNSEKRKSIITVVNVDEVEEKFYTRYSSYNKLLRIIAWIYRFYENVKKKPEERAIGELTALEIDKAELTTLKLVQTECFSGITDKRIRGLQPMIDSSNLIRVKSRILRRNDLMNFRLPILLPSEHFIVTLLIKTKHEMLGHIGVQHMMSELRETYWVLKCRRTVRKVIRSCTKCRKFDSQPIQSPMAPLPEDRVRDTAVFEIVGVDLAGPLFLRGGSKSWIVIYTCATYRAVHLELVSDLSTENFLQSFRRFIGRRGRPLIVYCDNGSNFTGAYNLFKGINWNIIMSHAATIRITWKFIPPASPWWGGWWERLIGMLKRILRKVLGRSSLNYEDMITVLCDCESLMNERPLTYVSEDISDLESLRPSMFLKEIKESGVPDLDCLDSSSLNKRFRYRQQIREDLRKRFRSEYLGQLRQSTKYIRDTSPIKVGDIVIIQSDNLKRMNWPLARVIQVFKGKDGFIRLAKVKTKSGELLRPVLKLYPLEVSAPKVSSDFRDALPSSSKDCENAIPPEQPTPIKNETKPSCERQSKYGRKIKPVKKLNL